MTVTNGSVECERVRCPADFESKRAKVMLSFAVDAGEDVSAIIANVGELAKHRVLMMVGEAPAPVPARVARPPKAAVEPAPVPVQELPDLTVAVPDGSSTDEPKVITDAMLDAAIKKARAGNVSPDQIKTAILGFTAQPGVSVKSLDQEQRPLFIAKIEALHPAVHTGEVVPY